MSLAPQDAGRTQSGHRGSADHRECGTDRAVPLQECSSRDIPVSRTHPGHSGNSYSRTMCSGSWQRPGIQSLRPVPSWQSQGVAPCEHLSAALTFGQWTAHVRSLSDTPCTLHTVRASRTAPDSAGQPWPWAGLSPCDCCQLPSAGSSCPGVRVTGRSTGRSGSSVWQHTGARSGAADRQGRARTDALRKGPAQGQSCRQVRGQGRGTQGLQESLQTRQPDGRSRVRPGE